VVTFLGHPVYCSSRSTSASQHKYTVEHGEHSVDGQILSPPILTSLFAD